MSLARAIDNLHRNMWLREHHPNPNVRRQADKTLKFAERYGRTPVAAIDARARVSQAKAQRRRDEYMARQARISMAIFWGTIVAIQVAIVVMVVLLATA